MGSEGWRRESSGVESPSVLTGVQFDVRVGNVVFFHGGEAAGLHDDHLRAMRHASQSPAGDNSACRPASDSLVARRRTEQGTSRKAQSSRSSRGTWVDLPQPVAPSRQHTRCSKRALKTN